MKDLTISLTDQPGSLAALGEATGRANVNIEGACAYVEYGRAVAHICVDDADGARRALTEAGLEVTGEQDVIVVQLEDRPAVPGAAPRRMAEPAATPSPGSPPRSPIWQREHGSWSPATTSTEPRRQSSRSVPLTGRRPLLAGGVCMVGELTRSRLGGGLCSPASSRARFARGSRGRLRSTRPTRDSSRASSRARLAERRATHRPGAGRKRPAGPGLPGRWVRRRHDLQRPLVPACVAGAARDLTGDEARAGRTFVSQPVYASPGRDRRSAGLPAACSPRFVATALLGTS